MLELIVMAEPALTTIYDFQGKQADIGTKAAQLPAGSLWWVEEHPALTSPTTTGTSL